MGFEVVVRPAVFPNIRPQRPGLSLPGDAPDKGFASISGSGGGIIDLPWSESVSVSKGHHESRRQYQKVRVAATGKSGQPDWSNTHDYEVAERMEFAPNFELSFDPPKATKNMKLLGSFTRGAS